MDNKISETKRLYHRKRIDLMSLNHIVRSNIFNKYLNIETKTLCQENKEKEVTGSKENM